MLVRIFYYKDRPIARIDRNLLINDPNVLSGFPWSSYQDIEEDKL